MGFSSRFFSKNEKLQIYRKVGTSTAIISSNDFTLVEF